MFQFRSALAGIHFPPSLYIPPETKPFRYPEQKYGKGELRYVNEIPVLTVAGTPEEIGEQIAVLAGKPAARLQKYPRDVVLAHVPIFGRIAWEKLTKVSESMLPYLPLDYRREFEAMAKNGFDRKLLLAANTMFDIKNDSRPLLTKLFGCSILLVDPERSATGAPLFGRNFDYVTLGYLHLYSLVTIYRPAGKHTFASVGFPGLMGCYSSMNDAGLSVATLEVELANDHTTYFDHKKVPYALCLRRLIEECTTVDEAHRALLQMDRATICSLGICDREGGAFFEVSPETVVIRRLEDGIGSGTNHFCSADLKTSRTIEANSLERFATLERVREIRDRKITMADVHEKLRQTQQDEQTVQTMIFEPAALRIHLAIGKVPTTQLPLRRLELDKLFC